MSLLKLIDNYDSRQQEYIAALEEKVRQLREENGELLSRMVRDASANCGALLKATLAGCLINNPNPDPGLRDFALRVVDTLDGDVHQ